MAAVADTGKADDSLRLHTAVAIFHSPAGVDASCLSDTQTWCVTAISAVDLSMVLLSLVTHSANDANQLRMLIQLNAC